MSWGCFVAVLCVLCVMVGSPLGGQGRPRTQPELLLSSHPSAQAAAMVQRVGFFLVHMKVLWRPAPVLTPAGGGVAGVFSELLPREGEQQGKPDCG